MISISCLAYSILGWADYWIYFGEIRFKEPHSIPQMENTDSTSKVNKDLILRENLALQRTILANQTTFLSFLRTSMYFLVAGLGIKNLLEMEDGLIYQIIFYLTSGIILILGIVNYLRQNKKIDESRIHIGNFKTEYQKQS